MCATEKLSQIHLESLLRMPLHWMVLAVTCDTGTGALKDHRAEFEVAAYAIQCLGPRGEVKLTEWICGNKRAWMDNLDKTRKSFGNAMGHSELWWRSFFRKCHVLGTIERKLGNMVKGSQLYAILPADR